MEQLAEGFGPREALCATIQYHDQINGMAWFQGRLMVEPHPSRNAPDQHSAQQNNSSGCRAMTAQTLGAIHSGWSQLQLGTPAFPIAESLTGSESRKRPEA